MKTKKIIKPVIAIALFFFAAIALKGQEVRLFEKEIDASRGMTVSIENQFGDIECHTWNKNRIYVAVDVKGQLESEKRVKEKIDIEFDSSSGEVSFETQIKGNFASDESTKIFYTVKIPVETNISFENKFGNIFIESISGSSEIENKFGNVQIRTLDGDDNLLDVKFGNLEIDDINTGEVDVSNGNTSIANAHKLTLDAKFGNVDLGNIDEAYVDVKNGSISIQEAGKLHLDGSFGSVKIQEVTGELVLENGHGNTKIARISENVSSVRIDNKFGKVKIGIDDDATYRVHCKVQMGSFYYPEDLAKFDQVSSSMMNKEYEGKIGHGTSDKTMEIESKNGDVVIFVY
mgnify:CR=1 FL=1